MIYTSYFAKLKSLPENVIPIAICGKVPEWYNGLQYKKLAPKYDFFMKWKENHDDDYYVEHFQTEVLDTLDMMRVLNDIQLLIPYDIRTQMQSSVYNDKDLHVALICYEKPMDFCHRHLVADWLNKNGIKCEEWN